MGSDDDYKVPAIVTGSGLNALGVIRSLGRAGVPVTVVASDAVGPAMYSRYARRIICQSTRTDAIVEVLARLGRTFRSTGVQPVLFLTEEYTVSTVSRCQNELTPFFRITLPTPDILSMLMHKDDFHAAAEATGAIVPRTLRITDAEGIGRLSELRPPLIVKPSFHDLAYASAFQKAYHFDSVVEAQGVVQQILGVLPDVVVQEWIEGEDSNIYFCLQFIRRDGESIASFVGRKLRSWPPRVGGTACCTAAPDALHLSETTTQFFREVGVVGLASMEYKKDARNGRFFMVEPTVGRTDYQEEVATLNGINIPLSAYRAELGLPLCPTTVQKKPRVWRDRQSALQSVARTGVQIADRMVADGHVVDALWRLYDPMPGTALFFRRAYKRMRRTVIRLATAVKRSKHPV